MSPKLIHFKSMLDYNKLFMKGKKGEWSIKYIVRKIKSLEKKVEADRKWLAKIAAKVLHEI